MIMQDDASTWQNAPLDDGERSLADIADRGPAGDWSDTDCVVDFDPTRRLWRHRPPRHLENFFPRRGIADQSP